MTEPVITSELIYQVNRRRIKRECKSTITRDSCMSWKDFREYLRRIERKEEGKTCYFHLIQ